MENPFRSMIFDLAQMLPPSCQTSFIGHAESLLQNPSGYNRAFAIMLICTAWILIIPGKKRREDAETARELQAAKRLKALDSLIDKGHIIPFSVRWPLLAGFIIGPLLTGGMMLNLIHVAKDDIYSRPLASGPGFTIQALPGEDPKCALYSPAAKPRVEKRSEEGWYDITPFLILPKLQRSTDSE